MTDQILENTQNPNNDGMMVQAENQQEKLVPQHVVNQAVSSAKKEAYEKGRKEAMGAIQSQSMNAPMDQNGAYYQQNNAATTQSPTFGGMSQMTPDQIRQMIADETRRMQEHQMQQMQAHQIANDVTQRVQAAKDRYPDLEDKMVASQLHVYPNAIRLAHASDVTADVLNELAENPTKAYLINETAKTNPQGAIFEMQKLVNSIKQNHAASSQKNSPEPLSQVTPSVTSTDNGSYGVRDWKKNPLLRG